MAWSGVNTEGVHDDDQRHETVSSSTPTTSAPAGRTSIITAFVANIGIAAAKFLAWLFTGSASMLAEAIHSTADSANQGLLLWGHHRSKQSPNRQHQFGFGRERYFWALMVAVMLFAGGGLFALFEGEEKLRIPHQLTSYPWSAAVLILSFCLEAVSLRTAMREARLIRRAEETWREFIQRTTVPEIAVVLLEDTGALIGLMVAFAGTTAAEVTGNPRFDALGSLGIGILLAGIALTLATEMKSLLIGEAAGPGDTRQILAIMQRDPGVECVENLRSEHIGPDQLLIVGTVSVLAGTAEDVSTIVTRVERNVRTEVDSACLVYLSPRIHPHRAKE